MKIKNQKNEKIIIQKKTPTKLSWPMSAKSDKRFIQKEKKSTKLPWPMSAKSDAQLPGFIYNEIRIFFNRL